LDFVLGGWVSSDEACTYYEDIILQTRIGHQFLLKELNVIPTIGWNLGNSFLLHSFS
jgi:hypothetical protein